MLSKEGLVVKKQGKGTFVTEDKRTLSMDSVQGFYSLLVKSGAKVETALLNSESTLPNSIISKELDIDSTKPVRKLKRLYSVNQKPSSIITTYLFKDITLTDEEAETLTVYGILVEKLNVEPVQARYQTTATLVSESDTNTLSVPKGSPLLILKRTSYSHEGIPIVMTEHRIIPDECNLEFMLKKDKSLEDLRIFNSHHKEL